MDTVGRDVNGLDTALRRGVDVLVAVVSLVALAPVLVVLAAGVLLTSPGPALYRQSRVGRNRIPFTIWKFRTMVVGADRIGPAVTGTADPRVTRLGRWLRASRLDELPQLVNLLRGEVTLVGPRPEVARFLPYYTPAELGLFTVRPGILGPGALLFAETQAGQLDRAEEPDAYYAAHHLHPKLTLDLAYLADRRLLVDIRLAFAALGVLSGRTHPKP